MSNLGVIRRLHSELPAVKVMALAIHSDKRFVRETLKAGAAGYLLKYLAHEGVASGGQPGDGTGELS